MLMVRSVLKWLKSLASSYPWW
uniref:Uncharacterized protein n=1 Tax=Anguilla anguilla TaxID=7936 RepID=A0A0E9PVZ1_ANGAN